MNQAFSANKMGLKPELLFNQFWEISVDGMRLTDEQGNMIAVNKSFCTMVKMNGEELLNKPFSIIYRPEERAEALEIYIQDIKNNAIRTHYDVERILWNNEEVWFDFTNSILDLSGSGKIVMSVIRDITARKTAEIELAKSEQGFRVLFNSANDAVFVNHLTADNTFGKYIEVNDLACRRLRYSKDELLNLELNKIIPTRYREKIKIITKRLLEEDYAIFEIEILTKDRRQLPVEISSHLFVFQNKPTVLSIARDIRERKRAEKQLRNSREQLRSLASRLQNIREEERAMIAREIHDELGQLLTVLKIQISLLGNKLPQDQGDVHEKLNSVTKFIDQAVESVQKITAKLRPGILDELGLIPAIEWQAQEFQKLTGINCDCSLPAESLKLDTERSTAIFRIFQEALTNVARHSFAKRVSIYLKRVDFTLVLEITDNGKGIRQSQINDPKSLGLLGIKERAMVFGGIVSINGVPDEGTNLKVELPID